MTRFAYLRTALASRRFRRAAVFMFLLAAMLKAMAVPAAASTALWSIKLARFSQNCQRGLGICIDPFGPLDGTPMTNVAFTVKVRGVVAGGDLRGELVFLSPLHQEGDTFFVERDILLDRRRSLELGYQSVTIVAGAYPIVRTSDNPNGTVEVALRTIGITITADIGRKAHGCTRFGICSITIGAELMRRPAAGSASLDGNRMGWDFLLPVDRDGDDSAFIHIDEDIELDAATSMALGAKRVVVKKGVYPVDYSDNPNGHVNFNVLRIGITITVRLGRKDSNCTGFGLCEASIRFDRVTSNPTPVIATLGSAHLRVDFTERPKNADEHFVIDEPIELDAATSLALGRQKVVLLPGSYTVDYSTSPFGSVNVPMQAFGIVVTIHVGRPAMRCTGYGFCGITIDFSAMSDRSVAGAASIKDGMITVDFGARAPEQGEMLSIDEDLSLDAATANALGYESVTLRRGEYAVDYSSNPYGQVHVPVAKGQPVVNVSIHWGRRSRGCEGVGFCHLHVDVELSERAIVGFVVNSHSSAFELRFASAPPESGDTVYVDEDIYLDAATSRALGADNLYVKRGAYAIDYSNNPYGTVRVETGTDGSASVDVESMTSAMSVWPSPTSERASVSFTSDGAYGVHVDLLDARGAVVMAIVDGERLERGEHVRTVDVSTLPAGAYFTRMTSGSNSAIRPLRIAR
jgi:hypothetical protein